MVDSRNQAHRVKDREYDMLEHLHSYSQGHSMELSEMTLDTLTRTEWEVLFDFVVAPGPAAAQFVL